MKKIILFALIAITCVSCLNTLEDEGVYATITYKGRLVDKSSLQPISGMVVQITDGTTVQSQATTTEDGRFQLEVVLTDITDDYYILLSGHAHYPLKKGQLVGFGKSEYDFADILLESRDVITTIYAGMIDETTLQLKGEVGEDVEYMERGFVYGKGDDPTIGVTGYIKAIAPISNSQTFEINIPNIAFPISNVLYARAYVIVSNEIIYGDVKMIQHPYLDLPTFIHSGVTYRVAPEFDIEYIDWFQATSTCKNLTYGGHSDWVIPTKEELNTMYVNRAVIGGFKTQDRYGYYYCYWSSSEYSSSCAWAQTWLDGFQGFSEKDDSHYFRVRCVRKEN